MSQLPFDLRSTDSIDQDGRVLLTVAQLNAQVKEVLQECWGDVWVVGEISNFRAYASGHWYFTLKDEASEIGGVMFRGNNRRCRFEPEDGMQVLARGGLDLYLDRGRYQLIVRELAPQGAGALQLAFEQLKKKLAAEGLFDAERKRTLPMLPRRIGIATSPDGAALRDILRVLRRRFANIEVLVAPCRVQGDEAAGEIAAALELLDRHGECDTLIVGRGGGSLEDLWSFNEEVVARAIAACRTPVISAVGHETDVTIADLVADLRAPTPSAAAEQVVGRKDELQMQVQGLGKRLALSMRLRLAEVSKALAPVSPDALTSILQGEIEWFAQRLDELQQRTGARIHLLLSQWAKRAAVAAGRMSPAGLRARFQGRRDALHSTRRKLERAISVRFQSWRKDVRSRMQELDALSPLAVLHRGYALVRSGRSVVRTADSVQAGDRIDVFLGKGSLRADVDEVFPNRSAIEPESER